MLGGIRECSCVLYALWLYFATVDLQRTAAFASQAVPRTIIGLVEKSRSGAIRLDSRDFPRRQVKEFFNDLLAD